MTLDSVVGNLYSNYNIGRQFPLIIKRSGDFYVQSRSKLTEDKFWDSKTKTFLKLDRSASYSSRSSKEKVEAAKKRWRGLYSFYNIFDNFGYEGYYNDEIEQRTAHDYNSAFALSFSYAQKAENKFTKVYNGVKLEQFDFESKPKMNKSQEAEVRTLADKAIFFTDKAIEFAKSEDEKRKANHYLARFKTNMFAMFEIYAKKVDINEWLTDDLYEKQIIEHAKNKLIGVKSGDIVFCDRAFGELLYVQRYYNIAKGAFLIPIRLLADEHFFASVLSNIGVKKDPDWLEQFNSLKLITASHENNQPLSEAFKLSYSESESQSESGYYLTYKNSKISISPDSRTFIQPIDLLQYFIIENLKSGEVYWSSRNRFGLKNNLALDGFLYKLMPTEVISKYMIGINGQSTYDKIVNGFEFDIQNMTDDYKRRYSDLYTRTVKSLAKAGELKKAQELYQDQYEKFKLKEKISWPRVSSEVELALSLNLPKYALLELSMACADLDPGIYDYASYKDQINSAVWKVSSLAKKYECPELSDVFHKARIYTKNTVKINKLKDGKSQLTTLTGQPIAKVNYDSIKNLHSNYCIVQKGNEWGIIDISGATMTNEKYLSIKQIGKFFKVQSKDGFGLISNSFKELIPAKFSKLKKSIIQNYANQSSYFIVENNGKFGVITIKKDLANETVPCEFSSIDELPKSYPQYFKCNKDKESFYLSYDGQRSTEATAFMVYEEVVEVPLDESSWELRAEEERLENVGAHIVKENGLSGIVYIRRNNNFNQTEQFRTDTIPFIYDSIIKGEAYYDWFFAKKDGLWGCVNIKNETLIPFKYSEIGVRHLKIRGKNNNPVSYVAIKDKSWGVFACEGNSQTSWTLGKEVCKLEYDSIAYNSDAGYLIWKDGKVGVFSNVFPNKIILPVYKKYKGVNTNFIQPIYTFIDEIDKEIRVYSGGDIVE